MRTVAKITVVFVVLVACGGRAGSGGPRLAARLPDSSVRSADFAAIEQLPVRYQRAETTQSLSLMMSLWTPDATLSIGGSTFVGKVQIEDWFAHAAEPFKATNRWLSLTATNRTSVEALSDRGALFFESYYLDAESARVVSKQSASATVVRDGGIWLIQRLTATQAPVPPIWNAAVELAHA